MSDSIAEPHALLAHDILVDFKEIAELNDFLKDHRSSRGTEEHRDSIVKSLGDRLIGKTIEIVELPIARRSAERPIKRYTEGMAWQGLEFDRLHPQTGRSYVPYGPPLLHKKRTTGEVEAIDAENTSIVTRPLMPWRLIPFDRTWTKVAEGAGELLVHLAIK